MDDWRIERLAGSHERAAFRRGQAPLDQFLHSLASPYEKRNLGRTCVAVQTGATRVSGYYTLASGTVSFEHLPQTAARKLARHPVRVILLARLAVDQQAQGQGLGVRLLLDAMKRCLDVAESIGVHAVEVDAIDTRAADFYVKYGFQPLLDAPLHLYLPIATMRDAFA